MYAELRMKRIAVLISNKGTGTNLAAIIDSIKRKKIKNAVISVVVSNKADALGLKIAIQNKIPIEIVDYQQYKQKKKSREIYDRDLGKLLSKKYRIDLVVLAGWMLVFSQKFINYFPNKIINLHPGMLPDGHENYIQLSSGEKVEVIRGLHTRDAVLYAINHKFPATGSTVHFITEKVDDGPVILRGEVVILPADTVDTLYERMKEKEHDILPEAIRLFCEDKLINKSDKVMIKP